MQKYICIHGHFYQPPRENAWLEAVEVQDSAYPYHDWNERITAECYGPNAFSRILDDKGRIARLVNNYSRISFNFGSTLLSWMADKAPRVYAAIIEADRLSRERFSGHGSALAQVYNHVIMPLANRRDKQTQVLWGIGDFIHRFGRAPEGMWLAETAVDLESLDVLAEFGIRFTILSPYQAKSFREIGKEEWEDGAGGRIDPTRAYVQHLPSGRSINLFFYDGPISRGVAFERLLTRAEKFAERLYSGFSDQRQSPQLVHIATDGESYGHHHAHGDMGLAAALQLIDDNPHVALTNYAEFLERHPPTHEVQIFENSSWSCAHGIERWRSDCGCNSGRPGWKQDWRAPLRHSLDLLRDAVTPPYQEQMSKLVRDPWAARDRFVTLMLNRSPDAIKQFVREQASRDLNDADVVTLLKLLEMQRNCMLMYTSCGWFFDDISGIEPVQIIQYAARVIQLAHELFGSNLEEPFLQQLEQAPSNVEEHGNGRRVYEKFIKPSIVSWSDVAAHYAVSSLFRVYPGEAPLFCFRAEQHDVQSFDAGKARMSVGRVKLLSEITRAKSEFEFAALYFGDHTVNAGVRPVAADSNFLPLCEELRTAFSRADFPGMIRLMDRGFPEPHYSLRSLFRDDQRAIIGRLLDPTLVEIEANYRKLYEQHLPTMRFLHGLDAPLPRAFQMAIDFVVNADLRRAYEEQDLKLEPLKALLKLAEEWHVRIDINALAYHLKKTLQELADSLRDHPEHIDVLEALARATDFAKTMRFEVDLWVPQNTGYQLMQSVYPDFEARAFQGDEKARLWIEHFLPLAEKLGLQIDDAKKKIDELKNAPTVASIVAHAMQNARIPQATYRLQVSAGFTFADVQAVVPYLHDLGISDVYLSPILKARPGSTHGYDICDAGQLSPELGGQAAFDALVGTLKAHKMGLLLDTVPNHMGIGHPSSNAWWTDVLENGPSSIYAAYFDIDWHPANPNLNNKVLLPILEDQYGKVLESGKLRLVYEDGAFRFKYYESLLPVEPASYSTLLSHRLEELQTTLGDESPHLQELHSILTALTYLPPSSEATPEKIVERNREKEVVKRRIAKLVEACPEVRRAVQRTVLGFNGVVGDSPSFDRLDRLLEAQPYRLAFWRVATDEINYRRFFDINELAAIRVERPEVFRDTHQLTLRLLAEGKVTGLRIDHPDGLWDPTTYFRRLQEGFLVERVKQRLAAPFVPEDVAQQVARALEAEQNGDYRPCNIWPLYVVAEKILGDNEPLPTEWAVSGTTGYDFLNAANGIFVDQANRDAIDSIYERFSGKKWNYTQLVNQSQKMIMLVSMASEVASLGHQLDRISERNRRYRDFTLNSLTFAVREIIAALFIYRTYINRLEVPSLRDRLFIEGAVESAKATNPRTAESLFDFVRDTLLLRNLEDFAEEDRPLLIDWVMKFQQVTGPVLAKGLEDTTFYIYNRLVSLNEVGGHPENFGMSVAEFHKQNEDRAARWPHAMLAGSTHDTKRSEDVRARINVLSEIPAEWEAALGRWRQLNHAKKSIVDEGFAPDGNEEYLLYQALLGAWPNTPNPHPSLPGGEGKTVKGDAETMPALRERIAGYMQKAINEAKVHTSWINPNAEYNAAMQAFVERLLPDNLDDPFLKDLRAFQERIAFFGFINGLAQLLLRLTSPGVPDFYQGADLWDLSLVDPDNRRPVDYAVRRQHLKELKLRSAKGANLEALAKDLLGSWRDGRIKLYLTQRTLGFRRRHADLFFKGDYVPLYTQGEKHQHACAFSRTAGNESVVIVVPRLVVGLCGGQLHVPLGDIWKGTRLVLPESLRQRPLTNIFTGETLAVEETAPLAELLRSMPVGVWYCGE